MSFSKLKQNRQAEAERLAKALQQSQNGSSREVDTRFWKPTIGKDGKASAVIRFLPAVEGEDLPYVQYFEHAFKHPRTQQWYIEKSLTTFGEPDPVSEYNVEMWKKGEAGQAIARACKRKLSFVSNIYVVNDSANPENNGKVFLFKYGKMIFEKLNQLMHPEDDDVDAVNPFDFWGPNFRLKIYTEQVGPSKFPKYDRSSFDAPSQLLPTDEEMEAVYNKQYPLMPLIARDQFKTYDELKTRLNRVLGGSTSMQNAPATSSKFDMDEDFAEPKSQPSRSFATDDEDDDALSEFQRLAADDDDLPF